MGNFGIEFDSNSGTLINCTIVINQADVHNVGGINSSSDYIDILTHDCTRKSRFAIVS